MSIRSMFANRALCAVLLLALCVAASADVDKDDRVFRESSKKPIIAGVCIMVSLIVLIAIKDINPDTFVEDCKTFLGVEKGAAGVIVSAGPSRAQSTQALDQVAKDEEAKIDPNAPFQEKFMAWWNKYFRDGQMLDEKAVAQNENLEGLTPLMKFWVVNRKMISIAIPAVIFHLCWWPVMIEGDYWGYFKDKYYMSITMVFGSMFAGCTSEGGAAVAFPVMTLVFDIKPVVARDFSFMIQSQGMTAAAFTIFLMRVKLEYRSIFYCTISGLAGLWLGLEEIAPRMDPPVKKILFVCVWASFAASLYFLNRNTGRTTFVEIPNFNAWKALALCVCGFVGGIFTSIAGSGIDICSFSVLTLLFRVSEKTATPTSVVLMGINTVVGFFIREFEMGGVHPDSWKFLMVCMPIVVFGAPIGSYLGSHLHRIVLAWLVYILDFVQLVGAYILVDFSKYPDLPYIGIAIIVGGFFIFYGMTRAGDYLIEAERGANGELDANELAAKLDKIEEKAEEGAPATAI